MRFDGLWDAAAASAHVEARGEPRTRLICILMVGLGMTCSCTDESSETDAGLGTTTDGLPEAGPTEQSPSPLPSDETEQDPAPGPVEPSARDAATPVRPQPPVEAGCHMIVVRATPHWGGESIAVPLCEEDVGCNTGDDLEVLALDPDGTCWSFPQPCVPEIWIAQGWEEVADCPMPPTPEAGTDASAPEAADAGDAGSSDGGVSPFDAAPLDAPVDAAR